MITIRARMRKTWFDSLRGLALLAALWGLAGTAWALPINGVNISGGSAANPAISTVVGYLFQAEANIDIVALGVWDENADGFAGDPIEVGLWTDTGTLLASTSVTSTDTLVSGFRFNSIAAVSLTAGSQYVVGALIGNGDQYIYNPVITNSAGITWLDSRAVNSGTLAFPGGFTGGDGWFGGNVQYSQAAPAPATLALIGIGLLGLGWSRRRKS